MANRWKILILGFITYSMTSCWMYKDYKSVPYETLCPYYLDVEYDIIIEKDLPHDPLFREFLFFKNGKKIKEVSYYLNRKSAAYYYENDKCVLIRAYYEKNCNTLMHIVEFKDGVRSRMQVFRRNGKLKEDIFFDSKGDPIE